MSFCPREAVGMFPKAKMLLGKPGPKHGGLALSGFSGQSYQNVSRETFGDYVVDEPSRISLRILSRIDSRYHGYEIMKNQAQRPGFARFWFFGSGGAFAGGLCRATFFNISSKFAGSSSHPSARAACANLSDWRKSARFVCCLALDASFAMFVPPEDYVFIADESGISNDRFTVVGGLCMRRQTLAHAYNTLAKYRLSHKMNAELKWQRVSNQKQIEYEALIDYFFAMNNANYMHFNSIVFDSHQWNHKRYNSGKEDVGISKLYYELLLHKFVKLYGNKGSLYIKFDHRNSQTPLEDIRRMLNATAARDHNITNNPVKQLVSEDSKKCDLLQLNDIILGAVCAARNGRHLLAGYREAKRALTKKVIDMSGLTTFDTDSPRGITRFTVWNMKARPR